MDIGSDIFAHGQAYVVLSTLFARGATQQLNGGVLRVTDPLVFREKAREGWWHMECFRPSEIGTGSL
jgi:hypothetical protein